MGRSRVQQFFKRYDNLLGKPHNRHQFSHLRSYPIGFEWRCSGTDQPTSWEWSSNGSADINDDAAQNTFAEDVTDGEEFTLTITDINGCEGSETVAAVVGGFEVDIFGGGLICDCSDEDTDVEIEITGGTAPYIVSIDIPILSFDLPINDISEIYRICTTDEVVPNVDASQDPVEINIPEFLFPIDLEVVNVVDATGCSATINGGEISFELAEPPEINQPTPPIYCIGSDGLVDLTIMEDEITGGENYDVFWFEDEDLDDEISNPSAYNVFNGNTVYAVVNDGTCNSEPIEIGLNFNLQPEITIIQI